MQAKLVANTQHQELSNFWKVSCICRSTEITNFEEEKYFFILVVWRKGMKIIRKNLDTKQGFNDAFYCRLFLAYSATVCNYYQL